MSQGEPEVLDGLPVSAFERAQYRKAVWAARKAIGWKTVRALSLGTDGNVIDDGQAPCEHCLGRGAVVLMQPAIASSSLSGDWVCGKCDDLALMTILGTLVEA